MEEVDLKLELLREDKDLLLLFQKTTTIRNKVKGIIIGKIELYTHRGDIYDTQD